MDSEYSRSRIPSPPQKMTTFTRTPHQSRPDTSARLGRPGSRAPTRSLREVLLEPGLASEVPVLLSAQDVGDPPLGQLDVGVGQHLVSGDVAPQLASLDEALGEIAARAHLLDVRGLSVGHVHAILIEY